jgi:hypothetical protein
MKKHGMCTKITSTQENPLSLNKHLRHFLNTIQS